MKKLITTIALAAAITAPTFAQTERVNPATDRAADISEMEMQRQTSMDDFSKMARSQYEVDLRGLSVKYLGLDEEQTKEFTPLFLSYMSDKKMLMERRTSLLEEYKDEMAEDDTREDEENETADFVENYWELDIDEMELKKDYFDRLEDITGTKKALSFFSLEKQYSNRINRMAMLKSLPIEMFELEPISYSYEREYNDYNNWNKINIDGSVSLDHEYTYDGLKKLLTLAEAMSYSEGIEVENFSSRKAMIMERAEMLKKNWKSLDHADYARKAFSETSELLTDIASDSRFNISQEWTMKLAKKAAMIEPNVKLTDQAEAVNGFFSTAETIMNNLVDQANGMTMRK